jgi:hypothetical protein
MKIEVFFSLQKRPNQGDNWHAPAFNEDTKT